MNISWPVGAGEVGEVLRQGGHAEGLVEDAAVPVPEGVPAGGAQQGEWDAPLGHGCCGLRVRVPAPLASAEMFCERAVCLAAGCFYTCRHLPCQQSPPL